MKKPTKPFKVGTYQLGFQWVDLWVDPSGDSEGSFDFLTDEKRNGRLTVGIANKDYGDALGTLLHEAIEVMADDMQVRFRHSNSYTQSSDMYTFIMDHSQFTELCARAGSFVRQCQVDFMVAHLKLHPKSK